MQWDPQIVTKINWIVKKAGFLSNLKRTLRLTQMVLVIHIINNKTILLLRLKPHTPENYRVLQVNTLQNKKKGCQSHIAMGYIRQMYYNSVFCNFFHPSVKITQHHNTNHTIHTQDKAIGKHMQSSVHSSNGHQFIL